MERKIEPVENTKKIYAYTNARTYTPYTPYTPKPTDNKKNGFVYFYIALGEWMGG